ncbi:zinc finger protein 431-like [Ixodes scapularis]|uniref:zinc finger protein 431-like n=1 Tax=Ixodes scapularis TaxID=6945 RepID=UPI001C38FD06|nr:zinc finger protein 431-like [Ixodes scapularis]
MCPNGDYVQKNRVGLCEKEASGNDLYDLCTLERQVSTVTCVSLVKPIHRVFDCGGVTLKLQLDTGAPVSTVTWPTYIKHQDDWPRLHKTSLQLSCFLGKLPVRGRLDVQVSFQGDGATLLGETSCTLKVTEDIWIECCSCTYVTTDQHVIVSHLAAHGDEQSEIQHPRMSGCKSQVLGNIQKHKSEKPFKCKQCLQAFARNSNLTIHNRMHTGEKPYKCKQCPQAFAQNSSLQRHNRTHTGDKPFKCKQCPRAFAQNSFARIFNLRNHNRTHTGEKPFKCKQCPKAFAQDSKLQNHNQTHTGEKPFKCNLCPRAFARNSYLKNHNQTHTGEKPFKCMQCPKAFAENFKLKLHNRSHTDEKPFKCKKCLQAFVRNSNLRIHNRIHTGEKPIKCKQCAQAFAQNSSLHRHNQTHTEQLLCVLHLNVHWVML